MTGAAQIISYCRICACWQSSSVHLNASSSIDPPKHINHMQENWEPNFSCTYERRLGSPGDGGKWVCDPHKLRTKKDCLIYSFGSENKFDFEEAVLQQIGRNCEVHTFDHTVGPNPSNKPSGVNFHPWGLGIQAGALDRRPQVARPDRQMSSATQTGGAKSPSSRSTSRAPSSTRFRLC